MLALSYVLLFATNFTKINTVIYCKNYCVSLKKKIKIIYGMKYFLLFHFKCC